MKKHLLLIACCVAACGASAQDRAVPEYLKAKSTAEYVSGAAPLPLGGLKVGEARWTVRGAKSTKALEQQARRAIEDAAKKLDLPLSDSDDALVVSTTWEASYAKDRSMVPDLSEAERSARCVEKGPDVSRVVGGVVGLVTGGIGQHQAASMIGSGARTGNESLQWQRFDHLAAADRVVCGRGEHVLATKVKVTGAGGEAIEFVVRSALPGGVMPAEAATLVDQNAEAVARELQTLNSAECKGAIRCCGGACMSEVASASGAATR